MKTVAIIITLLLTGCASKNTDVLTGAMQHTYGKRTGS